MGHLSPVGEIVRRHDPDRYLTALFAPASGREALFVLYAFNHELARAREAVREPMAALIRLQWWREVVEGVRTPAQVRGHEVAGPLSEALAAGVLDRALLGGMVDAREAETEAIETLEAFEAYVRGTAGGVMVAAAAALGMADAEALRQPGAAYGVAGVLRSAPMLIRQGRSVLPRELEVAGGDAVRLRLSQLGRAWLETLPAIPRDAMAAALPLLLARRDLRRTGAALPDGPRGPMDRLAVVVAGLTGVGLTGVGLT